MTRDRTGQHLAQRFFSQHGQRQQPPIYISTDTTDTLVVPVLKTGTDLMEEYVIVDDRVAPSTSAMPHRSGISRRTNEHHNDLMRRSKKRHVVPLTTSGSLAQPAWFVVSDAGASDGSQPSLSRYSDTTTTTTSQSLRPFHP